jgi:hypothetical protein
MDINTWWNNRPSQNKDESSPNIDPNKVLIAFVLDRSGSMSVCQDETILAFNTYFDELKKDDKVDYQIVLTSFNHEFSIIQNRSLLSEVNNLNRETYQPDGMTALNDAVGKTINMLGDVPESIKVLFVVLTDGHENASQEFNTQKIQELITKKDQLPNWTFVYLGAVADAWDAGSAMGFAVNNIATFDVNNIGMTIANTASGTACFAASRATKSLNFYQGKSDMSNGVWTPSMDDYNAEAD